MDTMALVQAQVEADVAKRAAEVLERAGMSVSEAFQEMLQRTALEGALPFTRGAALDTEHDSWLRGEVQKALDDPGVMLSTEEFEQRLAADREMFLATRR